jgi:hypothetical protein
MSSQSPAALAFIYIHHGYLCFVAICSKYFFYLGFTLFFQKMLLLCLSPFVLTMSVICPGFVWAWFVGSNGNLEILHFNWPHILTQAGSSAIVNSTRNGVSKRERRHTSFLSNAFSLSKLKFSLVRPLIWWVTVQITSSTSWLLHVCPSCNGLFVFRCVTFPILRNKSSVIIIFIWLIHV